MSTYPGTLPSLETERLRLRPFAASDAPEVQRLAGDRDVAHPTLNIPHPYEDGMAEAWIVTHRESFAAGDTLTLAVTDKESGRLLGAIGLRLVPRFSHAEMGYWIGKPYWNRGYGSEAARAVLGYAFDVLQLHRIFARHMTRNPASGRVMQKIGMQYEGRMREHAMRWGQFEDLDYYGILRSEYDEQ